MVNMEKLRRYLNDKNFYFFGIFRCNFMEISTTQYGIVSDGIFSTRFSKISKFFFESGMYRSLIVPKLSNKK